MEGSGNLEKSRDKWHVPVLVDEVLSALVCRSGMDMADCTLGLGGLAARILEQTSPSGRLVGIDRDPKTLTVARKRLDRFGSRVTFIQGDFSQVEQHLRAAGIEQLDGLLFDLGVNSAQLDTPDRGFSFLVEGPLDMRMDQSRGGTAGELVARLSESELADIIFRYGEERYARRIAKGIVEARQQGGIDSTTHLASIIRQAVPNRYRHGRIHCSTRTFQALRIATNHELDGLERALRKGAEALSADGRMCVISFHSLEDRIVKRTFKSLSEPPDPLLTVLTKKPVTATEAEVRRNPRSRSAKLRVAARLSRSARS